MSAAVATTNETTETASGKRMVDGILLLYHHPQALNAPTILEHVHAFEKYSRYPVTAVNTEFGFPPELEGLHFRVVVLHYSLFGVVPYMLSDRFRAYLKGSTASYKIAFFQDEYQHCLQRFSFINRNNIDCIYSLLQPEYFQEIYGAHTPVKTIIHHLPSYVDDNLLVLAQKYAKPDSDRTIDVGYRGRMAYFHMGKGAREKQEIGGKFQKAAWNLGLRLDIDFSEASRIYGERWYQFLGNCRGSLGVETGVSIFDFRDEVKSSVEEFLRENPYAAFEEVWEKVLYRYEGRITYRTIGPRHFEAIALRSCQILYEGYYSGVLKAGVHYLPLKKDFSNFREVINQFRDPEVRLELTANAYRDIIASGRYSYRQFIAEFDDHLASQGLRLADRSAGGQPTGPLVRSCRRLARANFVRYVTRGVARRGLAAARRILPACRSLARWIFLRPFWYLGRFGGVVVRVFGEGYCRGLNPTTGPVPVPIPVAFAGVTPTAAPAVSERSAQSERKDDEQGTRHRSVRKRREAAGRASEKSGLASP